jgi:dihydroorotate dehydrogenase
VQLYTALVFAGPSLVTDIKKGVAELLRADGFTSVAEAVGASTAHSRSSLERVGVAKARS